MGVKTAVAKIRESNRVLGHVRYTSACGLGGSLLCVCVCVCVCVRACVRVRVHVCVCGWGGVGCGCGCV